MPTGTVNRAGANWFPATCSVSAARRLMGMVMRSSRTGVPWRS